MKNSFYKLMHWPLDRVLRHAITLELIEKGYRLRKAKQMMKESGMLRRIERDPEILDHCYTPDELAEWVERQSEKTYA